MQFLPMADKNPETGKKDFATGEFVLLDNLNTDGDQTEVCCGGPPPPKSLPFEMPGYVMQSYVEGFLINDSENIPLVKTSLEFADHVGTIKTRLGVGRDSYLVPPGLYGVGKPGQASPVIVTANYKLTFDYVRKELEGIDCFLLVLDTCGINVWCAAGKNTFSTDEIVRLVEQTGLASLVNHKKLIVPQLGATGVAAHEVKLKCGFRVVWGPIRAEDLKKYIENEMKASKDMRAVTFSLIERFELIPVEFYLFSRKIWWIFPLLFLVSGFDSSFYTLIEAINRGALISLAVILAGIAGAMVTPLLLPWIPVKSFSLKGAIVGGGIFFCFILNVTPLNLCELLAYLLIFCSISSYLAMNFTGSTPFTSPSGVEKEMRIAIPIQLCSMVFGGIFWLMTPFI